MPEPKPLVRSLALRFSIWLGVAAMVLVLDRLSKLAVTESLQYLETWRITGFFNLVLVHNTGAAFSLLNDAPGWQRGFFIGVGVVASVVIVVLLARNTADTRFRLALSLILGGALGNMWDRVSLGHVIDFIQLLAGALYWPAFNVADSAICCGAGLLIWDGLRSGKQAP